PNLYLVIAFVLIFAGHALAKYFKLNYRFQYFLVLSCILYLISIFVHTTFIWIPAFALLAILIFDSHKGFSFAQSFIVYLYLSFLPCFLMKSIYFMEWNVLVAFLAFVALRTFKIKKLNHNALLLLGMIYLLLVQFYLYQGSSSRFPEKYLYQILTINSFLFWFLLRLKNMQVFLLLYFLEKEIFALILAEQFPQMSDKILFLSVAQVVIFILAHPKVLKFFRSEMISDESSQKRYFSTVQKYLSLVCTFFVLAFWWNISSLIVPLALALIYQIAFFSTLLLSLLFVCGLSTQTQVSMDFAGLFLCYFLILLEKLDLSEFYQDLKIWFARFKHLSFALAILFTLSGGFVSWDHIERVVLFKNSLLLNLCIFWLLIFGIFYQMAKVSYRPSYLLYLLLASLAFLKPELFHLIGTEGFLALMFSMVGLLELVGRDIIKKDEHSISLTLLCLFNFYILAMTMHNHHFMINDLCGALFALIPLFYYKLTKEKSYLDAFYIVLLAFCILHPFFLYSIGIVFGFVWFAQIKKISDCSYHLRWCSFLLAALVIWSVFLESAPLIIASNFAILALHIFALSYYSKIGILVDISFFVFGMIYLYLKQHGIVGGSVYGSYALLILGVLLELLSRVEKLAFFQNPFVRLSRIMPAIALFKEFQSIKNLYVFLLSGGIYECFQDNSRLSYTRLLGLLSLNLACFAIIEEYQLGWEILSSFLGFSVLWYAKTVQDFCSKESMMLLKVTGSFLFYSGFLYQFVMSGNMHHLIFLWVLCIFGGLMAIFFEGRIQLYMSFLVFVFSVIFFVIKQILMEINIGLPAMMGLGLILMIIGIILEKNKSLLVTILDAWNQRFAKWSD
ncbi:hypothetical protein MJH12_05165, partial [bacterium]|nr:hypothetical protein [bacterium]